MNNFHIKIITVLFNKKIALWYKKFSILKKEKKEKINIEKKIGIYFLRIFLPLVKTQLAEKVVLRHLTAFK